MEQKDSRVQDPVQVELDKQENLRVNLLFTYVQIFLERLNKHANLVT